MLYALYQMGRWLAIALPLPISYGIACLLADGQYHVSRADREAVSRNLSAILGPTNPRLPWATREVFRNFAKYLVDFFRLERVDEAFIAARVTVVGREHIDEALRRGRGAILLSAHLGNYELGAAVAAALGYTVNIVVLHHQDPRVNAFFTTRRMNTGVQPIPVGMALRRGFACLKRNELLGMLADRDFFNNGLRMEFLGRQMSVPKGPALFSVRTGALIVPTFVVREAGARYRFIFERPIELPSSGDEARDVAQVTQAGLTVLERYIRQYPSQWYLFRDFDNPGPWVIL